MKTWELVAGLVGGALGSLVSMAVCWLFLDHPTYWLAGILGGLAGCTGGVLGQNFVEGCVTAVISVAALALLLLVGLPWPMGEIGTGLLCGTAIGWMAHGVGTTVVSWPEMTPSPS